MLSAFEVKITKEVTYIVFAATRDAASEAAVDAANDRGGKIAAESIRVLGSRVLGHVTHKLRPDEQGSQP